MGACAAQAARNLRATCRLKRQCAVGHTGLHAEALSGTRAGRAGGEPLHWLGAAGIRPAGRQAPLAGLVPHRASCMRQRFLLVLAFLPETTQVALNCRAGDNGLGEHYGI